MPETQPRRRFSVHSADDAPSRAALVDGASFEDAALQFVEHLHAAPDGDDQLSLLVEDCDTGERECYRIDLATGSVAPCDEARPV